MRLVSKIAFELRDGEGTAVEVALEVGAALLKQEVALELGLDAFGNDVQAQLAGKRDDGFRVGP